MMLNPRQKDTLLYYKAALSVCIVTLLLVLYSDFAADSSIVVRKGMAQTAVAGPHRRFAGRQQQQLQQQQPCTVGTKYISSAFEQSWLDNVTSWQENFCEAVKAPQQQTWAKIWLDTIKEEAAGSKQVEYDPQVFSRFVTTASCPGQPPQEVTTWIEPLAHGLRHPHALCDLGSDLMDRGYLLLENHEDIQALRTATYPVASQACHNRTCQAIYMDLGATRWEAAPTSVGQGWFVRGYQARGIDMDRLLLWEAAVLPPSAIFGELPKEMFHKYQYFNIPAITDYNDASHPVRMLKAIAQPADFVSFKLDIDNHTAENAILKALREDPAAASLVDEFFLEYHVNFQPMKHAWGSTLDPSKTLADAFQLFFELRQQGWRAHSWV
ncbi:hypothetical protein OEZ85_000026 [Tetradesmus obliquus]|uniref:Glycosyl transferase CAP10 domain-containing protein n=1 Tax=Tetradesmus obliquus TaxID=3088 RepID=A0ABY8UQ52_TETOB|nr:hypothetical protein OEZ85_000026 [Tetradesmus obliquus]